MTKALTRLAMVQVKFSADGNFLYTGARKDPDILCWDVRHTSDVVYRLQRDTADTNQRIQFDIEPVGRHLASGAYYLTSVNSQGIALLTWPLLCPSHDPKTRNKQHVQRCWPPVEPA